MSAHLEKAQAALSDARDELHKERPDEGLVRKMMHIAEVQAMVSQAESLERLASCVESSGVGQPRFRTKP